MEDLFIKKLVYEENGIIKYDLEDTAGQAAAAARTTGADSEPVVDKRIEAFIDQEEDREGQEAGVADVEGQLGETGGFWPGIGGHFGQGVLPIAARTMNGSR